MNQNSKHNDTCSYVSHLEHEEGREEGTNEGTREVEREEAQHVRHEKHVCVFKESHHSVE